MNIMNKEVVMNTPIAMLEKCIDHGSSNHRYKLLDVHANVINEEVTLGAKGDILTEIDIESYTLKDMYSAYHSIGNGSIGVLDGFIDLCKYYEFKKVFILKLRTVPNTREDIIGILCSTHYESDRLKLLELYTDCLSVDYSRKGQSSCQILKCKYKEEDMLLLTDIHFY